MPKSFSFFNIAFIEKLGTTSPVLAWLLEYINERIADDKRWNVSDEVKSFGRNIFDEGYIEKGEVGPSFSIMLSTASLRTSVLFNSIFRFGLSSSSRARLRMTD